MMFSITIVSIIYIVNNSQHEYTLHNTAQYNATQHDGIQDYDIQHNDSQHNDGQQIRSQHNGTEQWNHYGTQHQLTQRSA